ncbi:hypothetical protein [Amycolatopsis sp. NPDC059021]|uniref:hypothetical protein n=1 Tax=Amycolatopsis sp. NPDC059021 TaxID=3346704 RepID=UPI0036715327
MSPVSRARKIASQPTAPSVNGVFKDVLRDFSALGADPGAFDVELLTSEVLGQWWDLPLEEDQEPLGLELIAFAQRKITPGAAALLAALRVVAETQEERDAAAEALAVVLGRGIPEPEWAASVGEVKVGECWRTGDVYGDESSLLCVFSHGERAHGLLALLDFTDGGRVRDLVVIDEPQEVLAEMREQAAAEPELVVLSQVEPAEAHRLLVDGLAATDVLEEPDVSEDYARFHAIALTWCRALPDPAPSPDTAEWDEATRDAVVEDFVTQSGIDDTGAARVLARLLVDHGCETEPSAPLRVGPEKIARFLEALLDGEFDLDGEHQEAVAPVLLAWTAWAAGRAGLGESAVAALVDAVTEYLDEYATDDSALDAYLDGSEELEDPTELAEALDRRMFAIPSLSTVIGDEEVDLEPTDPEQRRLLVIGEHPEYHESLASDTFDGAPRMHLELKTALVDQLWDNEPPEAWEAASRLRENGLERDEILDQLVGVLEGQLRETGPDRLDYDVDGYRKALDQVK